MHTSNSLASQRLQLANRHDAELLRRARNGERAALEILLGQSRGKILNLAFQILRDPDAAEDAAQETFVRAFQKLPLFRGESEFSTWLYRLALNLCLEKRRTLQRREQSAQNAPDEAKSENFAARIETRIALENALDELPESLRLPLILREWHGLNYEEIAEVLRIPVGTVKSRLNAARRQFRQVWEAQNEE